MKIEISTQEILELRGQLFAPLDARIQELERKREEELRAYRTPRNPLGMTGEHLAERVADLTVERITAAIAANQAAEEADEDSDDALAARISEMVAQTVGELLQKAAAPVLRIDTQSPEFTATCRALREGAITVFTSETSDRSAAEIAEEAAAEESETVTLGDVIPHVRAGEHPDYPNRIVAPEPESGSESEPGPENPEKDAEEAAPVEVTIYPHSQKISGMPAWDESAGVYIAGGNGFIGRDLWNKPEYRSWFNEEIRQLRAEGRSLQYIADRVKVSVQAVKKRMENYKIV